MEDFLKLLSDSKHTVKHISHNSQNLHIVLGNESCDLDSTVSALAYAHFLNSHTYKDSTDTVVIPVMNVTSENFELRNQNVHILKKKHIPLSKLVYRDDINLDKILHNKDITVVTTLVDHHVLVHSQKILHDTVVEIFDHRPSEEHPNWDSEKVKIRLEPVGSCATLIAEEIITTGPIVLFKELAHLLYCTIVYDTLALVPEKGKATDLDLKIAMKLEDKFGFDEGRQRLFGMLWDIHHDVSHFTAIQLLLKDMKIVEQVPVPSLPMLVEDFLQLTDCYTALESLATDHDSHVVMLIGLDDKEGIKRDIGVFYTEQGVSLKNKIVDNLLNCKLLKGYDLGLREVRLETPKFVLYKQTNINLSRKQIVPLLKL